MYKQKLNDGSNGAIATQNGSNSDQNKSRTAQEEQNGIANKEMNCTNLLGGALELYLP